MERRTFLAAASAAASAGLVLGSADAFLLPRQAHADEKSGKSSLEQRLADFALSVRYADLPPDVVGSAKRALLDGLACAFAAIGTEAPIIAAKTARKTFGNGESATIVGCLQHATVEGALFVDGVLVRALDLNDTYSGTDPLHPSEVLPTALALCEETGRSGRDLIEAIVIGYEASARINDVISFIERGFHPLSAASYAIPLIAGRVWNLPKDAIANAVGISGARGLTTFVVNSGSISMMKAMGLAATAADGVFATRLAQQGFTGPSNTLEWFAAKTTPPKLDLAVDLRPTEYRLPRVAFKRFPIQIELQAVAEAGSLLSTKIRGRLQEIKAIKVETYPAIIERVADAPKYRPQTRGTADHSLPVCLAMALLDGDVNIGQFDAERWRDGDVMSLVDKTSTQPGETLIAKLPKARGTSVEIVFSNGQSLRETVEVAEGDASMPISRESLERKFTNFAVPVAGAVGADRIVRLVERLEDLENVRDLTQLLRTTEKQKPI